MNSFELERIFSLIESNVQTSQPLLRGEVVRYIQNNEDAVVRQLRETGEAVIQTSGGRVALTRSDLQAAIA